MSERGTPASPFQPDMPRIPGVNDGGRAAMPAPMHPRLFRQVMVLAVSALVIVGGGGWWFLHVSRSVAPVSPAANPGPQVAAALPPTFHLLPHPGGPEKIATVQELSKPWSSQKFTFYRPDTGVGVRAMVVRLPGVSGKRSDAYWAFSLDAPYESCRLAYITNLNELQSRYGYPAHHPMVISTCSGTVYDPLQVGTAPDGAWVRGEVTKGSGIRPPFAIEVRVRGQEIIADKIEQ